MKNKIQLKTEEAIEQLNEHSNQMITEIEKFQKDCIISYEANEKAHNEFKKTKQELEAFNHENIDENISEAISKANEILINTKQDLAKLNQFIFNGGKMKFIKNENKLVFGSLWRQTFD